MKTSNFNRIVCLIMSIVTIASTAITASAANVMPIYERIVYTSCFLDSASSGQLKGSVAVSTIDAEELRGTVELKRSVNGTWVTVATWSSTANEDFRCAFTKYVLSGYTYKLYGTVDVYSSNGQYCETVYLESDPIYI